MWVHIKRKVLNAVYELGVSLFIGVVGISCLFLLVMVCWALWAISISPLI